MGARIVPAIDVILDVVGADLDIIADLARRAQASLGIPLPGKAIKIDEQGTGRVA